MVPGRGRVETVDGRHPDQVHPVIPGQLFYIICKVHVRSLLEKNYSVII